MYTIKHLCTCTSLPLTSRGQKQSANYNVHLYVAKFKDQSSLEFPLTGKFLLSTESITSVAFQLNSQSQFLIYSRIFRTFPIAIVFPGKKITKLQIYLQFNFILHIQPSAFLITIHTFDQYDKGK